MVFSLGFPQGWYIFFILSIGIWLFFSHYLDKKEHKKSLRFGAVALAFGIFAEAMGIGFGLWSYAGGNWPVILWPSYFIVGAASYLGFKVLDKK